MSLSDDMTKHRVFVQRLGATESKNIGVFLTDLKNVAKLEAASGTTGKLLQKTLRDVMKPLSDVALSNLTDIAEYESKFAVKVFNKYTQGDVVGVDIKILERALIKTNLDINKVHITAGKTIVNEAAKKRSLIAMYDQFGRKKADELAQIIKDGQLLKLPVSEVLKKIDERVAGLHTAQARTLGTTAVNYSTNIAKSQVIDKNRDIIEFEQWIATMDGTCDECSSLHLQIFPAGEAPDTNLHYGCACEVIPYVTE